MINYNYSFIGAVVAFHKHKQTVQKKEIVNLRDFDYKDVIYN